MAEHQRLAQFLRERCGRNQYGLRYLNQEQTLLYIPWPVAPKANEKLPAGFQMFREWAELSFRKRGNPVAAEQEELPTLQKHRFRNALARANGIAYCKDIQMEGARVYEFVENRRGIRQCGPISPESQDGTISDIECDFLELMGNEDDVTLEPYYGAQPVNGAGFQQEMAGFQQEPYGNGAMHYNMGLDGSNQHQAQLSPHGHSPVQTVVPVPQTEGMWTENGQNMDINDMLLDVHDIFDGDMHSEVATTVASANILPELVVTQPAQEPQYAPLQPMKSNPPEEPPELCIKLRFRQEEAMTSYVSRQKNGCRVYFGKNIPDLSLLLEKEHLDNIMSMFRFQQDYYYGPESLEQVQLPKPDGYMKTPIQESKTNAILSNMDRGLILFLDFAHCSNSISVPDVYAMRLCQTRIFPHREDLSQQLPVSSAQPESLKRMVWTKVFDGRLFFNQLSVADQIANNSANYPSPSFSLSLGQKPPGERSLLLVCLTVTVQRAQKLIQSRLDKDQGDICISGLNSVDEEAKLLARRLTETLTLYSQMRPEVAEQNPVHEKSFLLYS